MLRTKSGLPKHCSWNTDQHGKRRVRFRRRGFTTYLTGIPWSEDFMRQYAAALESVKEQASNVGIGRTTPGSFNALCVSYYRSPEFRGLKASTQAVRRNILERFRNEHGDKPVARLGRNHLKEIIGAKSQTPEAANNLLKLLRVVLNLAVDNNMIASNPSLGLKRYKSRGGGIPTWSDAEVEQFQKRHPLGTKAFVALAILLYSAQRRSDAVRMGWQHIESDCIKVRQEKTDTPLKVPMHPELLRALKAIPRTNMTFLLTEFGKPFSAAGFGNWFRDRCDEAGLPHRSAHGLRKAAATRLAEAGCTTLQIMAVTGHKSLSQVEPYVRAANQKRLAEQALSIQIGSEREQKLSNRVKRLDKKRSK
jgi:integrase